MKRYKLLKDLPFAKAGEIFLEEIRKIDGTITYCYRYLNNVDIDGHQNKIAFSFSKLLSAEDFGEWFEEVNEHQKKFIIDYFRAEVKETSEKYYVNWAIENLKSLGALFKTKQEAEKHLAYLKAKQIIKQDTNGFEPDWKDIKQTKYCGAWDFEYKELDYFITNYQKGASIYFKSASDIIKSFKNHPKEWKIYLEVEDEED